MKTIKIRTGVWMFHVQEPELQRFGKKVFSEYGVSVSAYLVDTGEGYAAIGAMPARYTQDWMKEIRALAGDQLRWVFFYGMDEDWTAAEILLKAYPKLTICGSTEGLFQISAALNQEYSSIEVRNDRHLVFGTKRFLFCVLKEKFKIPCLYIVDETDHLLFTADAFGSLSTGGEGMVSRLLDKDCWLEGAKLYREEINALDREESMRAAADLVRRQKIEVICPSSGPAVDAEISKLLFLYEKKTEKKNSLAILYSPDGYVKNLAELIEAGIRASGVSDVVSVNLSEVSRKDALEKIADADAYLFGTCEIYGDTAKSVWDIVTSLSKKTCSGKSASVFSSFSAKGTATENLKHHLEQLGFELSQREFSIQGIFDQQMMNNAYEYGFNFGCGLQKIPNPHNTVLVKCLICGEIFEASIGTCPVCGVGLDQCVPLESDDTMYRKDTKSTYLILGGGIAAVSAAEAIRQRDKTGKITMLSAEEVLPINRPMLTKNLRMSAENSSSLEIHDQNWYDERKIELHLGLSAAAVYPDLKYVVGSDGKRYFYDKLICATGAECFIPPFPGHDKPGVITIRHLSDVKDLKVRLEQGAKTAVVIGGGVLGLEAANELMRFGIHVTVLEAAAQIIGRQIDAGSAEILRKKLESFGVACCEGVSIAEITGEKQATGVLLRDGSVFPADFVIVSCGNRGNVDFAKAAGIEVERAIVVNEHMETNLPDVYACGDCCQFENVNFQLWQEASGQGKTAGANAAGERLTYVNQVMGMSFDGFGTSLYAIGDIGKKSDTVYKTVETVDHVKDRYEKYWFVGGALQGAVIIGAREKTQMVMTAVVNHVRYQELF